MSAAIYDLQIERGVDFTFSFIPVDENDVPLNLTGKTIAMQIRGLQSSPDVLVTASTTNGYIAVNLGTSNVTVTLPASETEKLIYDKSVYDLIAYTESPLSRIKMLKGDIVVDSLVTRLP